MLTECNLTQCKRYSEAKPNGRHCQMKIDDPQRCIIRRFFHAEPGLDYSQSKFALTMIRKENE